MLDRPTLPLQHNWTPAEDALLIECRAKGMSAGETADYLPGRSRNAICGRAKRLGIAEPASQIAHRRAVEGRARAREQKPVRLRLKPKAKKPAPVREIPANEPKSLRLTCEELTPTSCRYMAGDPKQGGTFCGHKAQQASNYCAWHHAIVWRPIGSEYR